MRRLMISAHPEWVEKILNGEKTVEVRPWIPKGELPLEVLIYVTKGEPYLYNKWDRGNGYIQEYIIDSNLYEKPNTLNGKVVAKFILNKAEDFNPKLGHPKLYINACVSDTELVKLYPNKNILFAWKIDDLKIFEEPKELGDYGLNKAPQKMVWVEE